MGFGHRVYRAEDPRARVLRRTAKAIGSPRAEVAEALEAAALAELQARKPDRVLATNVEFWSAVVLDHAGVPPELFTPLFTCARTAGWSAHILEQKREGRLIRPTRQLRRAEPRARRCQSSSARARMSRSAAASSSDRRGEPRRRLAGAALDLDPRPLALLGEDDGLHAPVALARAGARPGRRPRAGRRCR